MRRKRAAMNTTQTPSPLLFLQTMKGHERTAALKAALELGIFKAVGRATRTAAEIASQTQAAERGVRILCDYLCIVGFLEKDGQRYRLSEDTALFLDPASPAYLGGAADFMLSDGLFQAFGMLTESVRKGGSALPEDTVSEENPIWIKFARGMGPMMSILAQQLPQHVHTSPARVLDIAAGHGMFGLQVAQSFPNARVTALDWPGVLEVAKENVQRAGLEDRYEWLPGNAFATDFGGPYDLVLLTNFLHHFDEATCLEFLKKCRAAGKELLTLEFIPNEDRISPPDAAAFSLTMLATTHGGDAYTFSQLKSMLEKAGYTHNELRRLEPMCDLVISR